MAGGVPGIMARENGRIVRGPEAPRVMDLDAAPLPARDLLRNKEAAYAELGLATKLDDETALIEAMSQHPALINRPIVRTAKGTALCRPPETVLGLID